MIIERADFYDKEGLIINFSKSKLLIFSRHKHRYRWSVRGNIIDQVKCYKYLGVIFHTSGIWYGQLKCIKLNAQRSLTRLLRFFYMKGGQHITSTIKVFIVNQMLFGCYLYHSFFYIKTLND